MTGTGAASHSSGDSRPLNCTAVSPHAETAAATSLGGRVDEHADARHGGGTSASACGGLLERHLPRRRREDDADRVGPASTAAAASSAFVIPQILMRVRRLQGRLAADALAVLVDPCRGSLRPSEYSAGAHRVR